MHGVNLLKELLPVGPDTKCYCMNRRMTAEVTSSVLRAGMISNDLPQCKDNVFQITKIKWDLLQGAKELQLLYFVLVQKKNKKKI